MANFAFAPVRTYGKRLTTTAETDLYTVDERSYSQLIGVRVVNVTAVAANVTLRWFSATDALSYTIIFQQPVPANGANDYVLEIPIALNSGDKVMATAGTANALHVTTSLVETPGRSG